MHNSPNIVNFNKLFNDHYEQFVYFAMGYVKEEEKAQDFVSDAFATYWEVLNTLPPETNAPGYILTIVKNRCLNYLQHKKVKLKVAQEMNEQAQWALSIRINTLEACNPDKIFTQEILQIIDDTLKSLPKRTAEIFKMSRFDHLSHKEIAEKLNLSTKSIEYHISKTLGELRIHLKDFLTVILVLFSLI